MAEYSGKRRTGQDMSPDVLGQLRNMAENHLKELEKEKAREDTESLKRSKELERYRKQPRRSKDGRSVPFCSTPSPKMRSAQDVLDRLHWDPSYDITKYTIGYLERFSGIMETPADSWISESTDEEWIPQHRIKYFKRSLENGEQEVVWDRERRIDKFFGTGLSRTGDHELRAKGAGVGLDS
ncbi:hypothetical protein HRR83_000135 [Exophiala dermatitidis]|uniref:Poly(A) polymerase n=2 Tax=Exophiala dermatitidis TaxID=5970 RepID=H6C8E8_EXODN|nr:poly(A) polymerase [Exophiala dermatitidis NIH/UT8656]KAJ4523489.1 hypothetical protein HRR73_002671 [Exophiala dermatitidis]EHY60375.1 poly(A) polymerase [Exophiala dermatitidis NIH/UT8656]KAJ4524531.1 hypothetical protein HRR75_000120 [Exophiala dermatitidis]KAJ4527383.1 hypothetical protein HRR74_000136 [Exophiala dermatitidis]KAJ4530944.1 hypothetical protein HRR76_008633 [Exophiala dermatitidis]